MGTWRRHPPSITNIGLIALRSLISEVGYIMTRYQHRDFATLDSQMICIWSKRWNENWTRQIDRPLTDHTDLITHTARSAVLASPGTFALEKQTRNERLHNVLAVELG
jgi:hypothetical protein